MSQALYRKYRSASFDELVGQEHITELLKAAVQSGAISHAYLFTGPKGTGKTSVARILAHDINKLPYTNETTHLDIIEIDAASNRRIDDIRDLREKVHIAPVSARYKVYIIDEVHMLTGESFNALLKTLEEPPEHTVFILATTDLHKVPATIVSRTQRFHFRPVAPDKVMKHLQDIAKKETIDIDEAALRLIAEHGNGSFRDSIGLLDQVASLGKKITLELVESLLGRARSTDIDSLLTALEHSDQDTVHARLNDMLAQGVSPVTLSEQLVQSLLRLPKGDKVWYELAEQLMAISKANFPDLLLLSLLLGFTAPSTPPTPSPSKDAPATPQKTSARPASKVDNTPSTPDEPPTPPSPEALAPVEPPETPKDFDWEKVLQAVKKINPSLYAVINRAQITYQDNQLQLSFQYALHRKKLEQAQYKTQLSRAIQDVLGLNPEIVVEKTGPTLATDPTAQKVADLMGGGESVTV